VLRLDAGGIQLQFFQVYITERLGEALPDASFAPTIETPPNAVPVAEAFGEISPGDACFSDEKHGIDEEAIVFAAAPSVCFFTCDERFDLVPLRISQFVPS